MVDFGVGYDPAAEFRSGRVGVVGSINTAALSRRTILQVNIRACTVKYVNLLSNTGTTRSATGGVLVAVGLGAG